jgi:hypothetical protein
LKNGQKNKSGKPHRERNLNYRRAFPFARVFSSDIQRGWSMGLQHGAGIEMKDEELKWFLETLKKSRLHTRQDLQRYRAKVDELAETEVAITKKIESVEETIRKRSAA